jgi:hypothetical protein
MIAARSSCGKGEAGFSGILYAFLNARRERLGQIPEPVDNPPDDPAAQPPAAGPEASTTA